MCPVSRRRTPSHRHGVGRWTGAESVAKTPAANAYMTKHCVLNATISWLDNHFTVTKYTNDLKNSHLWLGGTVLRYVCFLPHYRRLWGKVSVVTANVSSGATHTPEVVGYKQLHSSNGSCGTASCQLNDLQGCQIGPYFPPNLSKSPECLYTKKSKVKVSFIVNYNKCTGPIE